MTINDILIEAAYSIFDFKGTKIKSVSNNFDAANKFLRLVDKSEINKIKINKNFRASGRGENILSAINIMAKVSRKLGSNYGEGKVNLANETLGRLEISFPDSKKEVAQDKFYKLTQQGFDDKHERDNFSNDTKSTEGEEGTPAGKTTQDPTVDPKANAGATQAAPTQAAPTQAAPTQAAPTQAAQPAPEQSRAKAPASIAELISLKDRTVDKIQKNLDDLAADNSLGGKTKFNKTKNILKTYQKQMDKLIEKAKAGPKNAGAAFNSASSVSRIAEAQAVKAGLKGAIGRTVLKGRETGQAIKKAGRGITDKVGKALDSEQAEKARRAYGKVKEKVVQATDKRMGKAGERMGKAGEKIGKFAETQPLKTAAEKIKTKTAAGIAKTKEAVGKAVGNVADKFGKKSTVKTPPKEGILKTAETLLSPKEQKDKDEIIRKLAQEAKERKLAKKRKRAAGIRQVPGVERIVS